MATGLGPKGQEGGAIPGCEVAGWGLAQTLVGNLHCEESQPGRLVWNLPKPGGGARREAVQLLGPARPFSEVCTLLYPGQAWGNTHQGCNPPGFPPVLSHSPTTSRLCLF